MFISPKRTSSFCVLKNKLQIFPSSFPSLLVRSPIDEVNECWPQEGPRPGEWEWTSCLDATKARALENLKAIYGVFMKCFSASVSKVFVEFITLDIILHINCLGLFVSDAHYAWRRENSSQYNFPQFSHCISLYMLETIRVPFSDTRQGKEWLWWFKLYECVNLLTDAGIPWISCHHCHVQSCHKFLEWWLLHFC